MRRLGQAGMPDAIRNTVESVGARPQRSGLRAAASLIVPVLTAGTACAAEAGGAFERSAVEAYASAFLLLDRHEIAALALTLAILGFAVVTADRKSTRLN